MISSPCNFVLKLYDMYVIVTSVYDRHIQVLCKVCINSSCTYCKMNIFHISVFLCYLFNEPGTGLP